MSKCIHTILLFWVKKAQKCYSRQKTNKDYSGRIHTDEEDNKTHLQNTVKIAKIRVSANFYEAQRQES